MQAYILVTIILVSPVIYLRRNLDKNEANLSFQYLQQA